MGELPQDAISEAKKQRRIQDNVDQTDREGASPGQEGAPPQTGAREYPVPPFAKQHISKPGSETEVDPAPMYDAPFYQGSGKLEGKVALITGGDSGIGRSVAVLFAREGADVAISYLSEQEDAEKTRQAIEEEGRKCLLLPGDVSDEKRCNELVASAIAEFGRIDILVNNAAFQYHTKKIDDLTPEHFDTTLKTNLYALYYMCRAAVPHMQQGSAIINTGSVAGLHGSGGLLDYSMTKGGIHSFTRSLASNLVSRGIRVNAVAPGPVWTPLNPSDRPEEEVAEFGADTGMKRPAQPEEIAPAYVFLASPQTASYITGEIITIAGGS